MYGIDVPMFFLALFFFNSQTFSMMFKSGDWAGHDSIGISLVSSNNFVWRDAWGGALSSQILRHG
jgi:hypothetical protein